MNRPLSPSRPRFPCPLAALLLSLVMLFAAAAPAVAQDEPAHQAFLFAYKLLQQGEDELAAEAFDDYLGDFADAPKRGDARYYRALLYRRAGKNEAAAAMLEKVAEPQLVAPYAVNLLRGQVLSDLKRYPQAIDALERIDAGQLEPEVGASVHHLRGIAYRGAGNLSAAAEQFEQAAELSEPRRGQALLDLARVQVRMDRLDDALATLDRVVELEAGQVAEAARLAGDLSYQHEQYGAAARYYARVARNHQSSPHFAPSVLGLLWSQFSAEQYGEVVASHEQFGEALDGENRGRAVYLAGSARQKLGEHERAIELLEQARPALTGSDLEARLLFRLASSQFSLGRFEAMRETAGELTRRRPDAGVRAQMQYLLALADARQGEVSQGVARLTRLIEQGTDAAYHRAALLRRAWLYEQHDQLEPAARDYARYLDAGDTGPEAHEAALRRIDLLLRLERYENVVTAADELLSQSRVAPSLRQQALYRLGLAQIRLDQAESALETLSHLQSEYPLNPFTAEADYYRGLLLMSLDRADEAAELLKKAASQESLAAGLRANAWRMVALRQREAGREDAAADSLAKLEEIAGRERLSADERLWLARYRLERGEFETALAYVERLTEMRPGVTPEQRAEALFLAGRSRQAMGQYDQAGADFHHVVAMGRGPVRRAQLELARTLAATGEEDEALMEFAGLHNAEASEIAARAHYASAMIYRERAAERRRQSDPAGADEANREARKLLKRMVLLYPHEELTPLPQLAHLELADIADELDNPGNYESTLTDLEENYPGGPWARYARAAIAAHQQRFADAIALLRPLRDQQLDPRLASRVEDLWQRVRR